MHPIRSLWPYETSWMRFMSHTHESDFSQYKCRLQINGKLARWRKPRRKMQQQVCRNAYLPCQIVHLHRPLPVPYSRP